MIGKPVDNLVEEPCKRVSLKEVAKARLTAGVPIEVSTQVEDDVINEGELDKQYMAIKNNYKTKVISKE